MKTKFAHMSFNPIEGIILANPLTEDDEERDESQFNRTTIKVYISSNYEGKLHETFFVKIDGSLNRMKLTVKGNVVRDKQRDLFED